MKENTAAALAAIILGIGLPWFLVSNVRGPRYIPETETTTTSAPETTIAPNAPIQIPVLMNNQVVTMELEQYLLGVVLGEMPAEFETEALKAQAVVARTFTLRLHTVYEKHENASVCTDSGCCQAYCDVQDYMARGGTMEAVEKVRGAVESTEGQVLTYNEELIEATYFSCSGGRTEDAVAVWGTDVPYLQATDSPGEEYATHFTDTVTFSASAFTEALGYTPEGPTESWIGKKTYTDGGGIESIQIGDRSFTGMEMRTLLSLRSTAFTITALGDSVTITTKGFGHRVGMSQYGADAMALRGSSYEEILAHYYRGTKLQKV